MQHISEMNVDINIKLTTNLDLVQTLAVTRLNPLTAHSGKPIPTVL